MRLSRYLQTYEVEPGVIGAYSPFGHEITFFNLDDWRWLKSGQLHRLGQGMLDDLARRKFLVRDGFEETALAEFPLPDEGIREMWLVVIQSCNMACQYCVVEGNVESPSRRVYRKIPIVRDGENHADVMTPEVAEAAISKFKTYIASAFLSTG